MIRIIVYRVVSKLESSGLKTSRSCFWWRRSTSFWSPAAKFIFRLKLERCVERRGLALYSSMRIVSKSRADAESSSNLGSTLKATSKLHGEFSKDAKAGLIDATDPMSCRAEEQNLLGGGITSSTTSLISDKSAMEELVSIEDLIISSAWICSNAWGSRDLLDLPLRTSFLRFPDLDMFLTPHTLIKD